MPRVPKIPPNYGMFRAYMSRPGRPSEVRRLMAPSERHAGNFLAKKYPDLNALEVREEYGPFYPSEERQIRRNGFSRAYEREVERRKKEMWDEFMAQDDVETYDPKGLDEYFEKQARYEINDYLRHYRESRLPVKEYRKFLNLGKNPPEWVPGFDAEGAADRLRFSGYPEEDIGPIIDRETGESYRRSY